MRTARAGASERVADGSIPSLALRACIEHAKEAPGREPGDPDAEASATSKLVNDYG
jgi:hypothetical protein